MSIESLPEAFQKISLSGRVADPLEKTAQFVRDVHKRWKEEGGKAAGKPRHSDRFLDDQLRSKGTPVRSLVPKLTGKTNISPTDGAALIRFFLTHWPKPGDVEGEVEYKSVLPDNDIENVTDFIEKRLTERGADRGITQVQNSQDEDVDILPGEPAADLIVRTFRECHAYIIVSPEHVLLASGRDTELLGFRDIIDALRNSEPKDHKRPIIWTLDVGGPQLDDLSTRKKYLNVRQLITRFKALEHFHDGQHEERLQWLQERGTIVLLDTHGDWRETSSIDKLPDFSTHHVTLTNVNPDWLASVNFRALYGSNLERVAERHYSLYFNAGSTWLSSPECDEELRYFGFGTFATKTGDGAPRGLELPKLPGRYELAQKTVCAAAFHSLRLKAPDGLNIDGEQAERQLSYLGIRILTKDEFINMY